MQHVNVNANDKDVAPSDGPPAAGPVSDLASWVSLRDVENHLRTWRPIMHHVDVDTAMVARYERVARTQGYDVSVHGTPFRGVATVMLVRREMAG